MLKAVGPLGEGSADGEGEDPRYAALWRLIQAARRDWRRWRARLVAEVTRMIREGALLPATPANRRVLTELLKDHETALVIRFAGSAAVDEAEVARLVERGLVTPAAAEGGGFIEPAYRIGRRLEVLDPVGEVTEDRVAEVLEDAFRTRLNRHDYAALQAAATRAGQYMKAPATRLAGDVIVQVAEADRQLSQAELEAVRRSVTESYLRRETTREAARRLRAHAVGTRLTNDMDRVARTEMVNAHAQGAKEQLRETAIRMGDLDPKVYKLASPYACKHCRRIWGQGTPTVYTLSEIERNDAAGGNFGLKAAEWVPTTGPTHPNCTCGPLMYWRPEIVEKVDEAVQKVLDLDPEPFGFPGT